MQAEVGKEKLEPTIASADQELEAAIRSEFYEDIKEALVPFDRGERKVKQEACDAKIKEALADKFPDTIGDAGDIIYAITKRKSYVVRF